MALTVENKSQIGVDSIILRSSYALKDFEATLDKNKRIQELKEQLELLKKKEDTLFAMLGGEIEFRKRLDKFRQDAKNFQGKNLDTSLIKPYLGYIDTKDRRTQRDFDNMVIPFVQKFFADEENNIENITASHLAQILNLTVSSWSGTVSSEGYKRRSGGQVGNEEMSEIKIEEAIVRNLTPGMQRRLPELLKELRRHPEWYSTDITMKSQKRAFIFKTAGQKIGNLTQGYSKSTAEKLKKFKNNKGIDENIPNKELQQINQEICDILYDNLGLSNNSIYKEAYDAVMMHMLNKNKWLFFVGRNEKQLTGLVGEICAMVLFYDLVGKFPSLEWAAQHKNLSGGQISVDIILWDGYGIQVKNSTKDLETLGNLFTKVEDVHISTASFDKLGTTFGFDSQPLEDLYSTAKYNYEYDWKWSKQDDRSHFSLRGNEDFNEERRRIEQLQQQFQNDMAYYGSSLLYMDDVTKIGQNIYSTEAVREMGNVLYMINFHIHRASDILNNLIRELEFMTNFGTNISSLTMNSTIASSKSGEGKNITDDIEKDPANFFSSHDTSGMTTGQKIYFTTSLNMWLKG